MVHKINILLLILLINLFLIPNIFALTLYERNYVSNAKFGASSSQSIAQTFTVGVSGNNETFTLKKVSLKLLDRTGSSLNLSIEIQHVDGTGKPNSTIISQNRTWNNSVVFTNGSMRFYNITMPDVILQKGKKYALILRWNGNSSDYINWAGNTASVYTGGSFYYTPQPLLNNWIVTATRDFQFETFGDNYTGTPIPPIVTIASPLSQSYSNKNISLNVKADQIITNWWYTNDSGATNYSFTPNITRMWDEGNNIVTVYANNSNGIGNDTVTFYVDSINPVINVFYPINTTYMNNVTYVHFNATNSGALDKCSIYLIGYFNLRQNCSANGTNMFSGLNVDEGEHILTIEANDSVGNIGRQKINFTIGYVEPNVNIIYPTATTYTSNITSINYFVTPMSFSLDKCWYSLDNGVTNSSTQSCSLNFTGLNIGEGNYTLKVYSNDTNNLLGTDTVYFNISYVYVPPVEEEDVTDTSIYKLFNSVGAGLGIFISLLGVTLPVFLLMVFLVVMIAVIGFALAKAIKETGFKHFDD